MARNEKTSKRVAAIAGKVLAVKPETPGETTWIITDTKTGNIVTFYWRDIRALAASALTQAPDKKAPKAKKARR